MEDLIPNLEGDDMISKLNSGISQITTANFNLHKESGDLQEWLDQWREDMGGISIRLFTRIKVLEDYDKCFLESISKLLKGNKDNGNDNQRD